MNRCGNDYGTIDRQTGLFLLTLSGSVFAGGTNSSICVRPKHLFLQDTERLICPEIVTYCTYETDPLQALYSKGYGRVEAQFY